MIHLVQYSTIRRRIHGLTGFWAISVSFNPSAAEFKSSTVFLFAVKVVFIYKAAVSDSPCLISCVSMLPVIYGTHFWRLKVCVVGFTSERASCVACAPDVTCYVVYLFLLVYSC